MRTRLPVMFSILGTLGSMMAVGCAPPDDGATDEPATGEDQAAAVSVPFNIIGIIGTGQSLSVGAMAPTFSGAASQPHFNNLKLALNGTNAAPPFNPNATALSLVAFRESIRPLATTFPSAYPANLYGETFHAAMADQVTTLAKAAGAADYVQAHTVVGESGQGMSVI